MRFLSILFLFCSLSLAAHIGPLLKHQQNLSLLDKSAQQTVAISARAGSDFITALQTLGIEPQSRIGKLITFNVPRTQLEDVLALPGLEKAEIGSRPKLHNDLAVGYQNVNAAYAKGYTGSGVIVGVVDTGIDFYNPMFLKSDGTTRILSIWDHNTSGTKPAGYSYGALYTEAQINQDLASGSPHSVVPQRDSDGHGTHVAGTAAGNDYSLAPNDTYDGGAQQANLIIVKTDFKGAHILDGVNYIFDQAQAAGKPCVVNLSLGSLIGPHDGTGLTVEGIAALTGPGKVVVRSAGNSGGDAVHYFADNLTTSSSISFGYSHLVNMWIEAGDDLSSVSLSWSGGAINNVTKNTYKTSNNIELYFYPADPDNGKIAIYVVMDNASLDGQTFTLTLTGLSDGNSNEQIERHVWAEDAVISSPYGGFSQGTLYGSGNSHYPYTLSDEACSESVIAVGAFMTRKYWNGGYYYPESGDEGGIASFSGIGPAANGVQKPDIIAGGTIVLSASSSDASYDPAFIPSDPYDAHYAYLQGTSMASPAAAGAIALLLEKHPSWTPADVLNYLKSHARGTSRPQGVTEAQLKVKTDPGTWDRVFGYGAVDLTYAFTVDAIEDPATQPQSFELLQNYPNPFNPQTTIAYRLHRAGKVELQMFNARGQLVLRLAEGRQNAGLHRVTVNGSDLASGVYLYKLSVNGRQQVRKMLLVK